MNPTAIVELEALKSIYAENFTIASVYPVLLNCTARSEDQRGIISLTVALPESYPDAVVTVSVFAFGPGMLGTQVRLLEIEEELNSMAQELSGIEALFEILDCATTWMDEELNIRQTPKIGWGLVFGILRPPKVEVIDPAVMKENVKSIILNHAMSNGVSHGKAKRQLLANLWKADGGSTADNPKPNFVPTAYKIPAKPQPSATCPICFDDVLTENGFWLPCGHFCCADDLTGFLRSGISDGKFCFTCPSFKCEEDLPEVVIQHLLDIEMYARYWQLVTSNYQDLNQTIYCPFISCQWIIMPSPIDWEAEKAKKTTKCEYIVEPIQTRADGCRSRGKGWKKKLVVYENPGDLMMGNDWLVKCGCDNLLCVKCEKRSHWPLTCEEDASWEEAVGKEQILKEPDLPSLPTFEGRVVALTVETKPCPKCQTPWEKDGGCNHIHCLKCRYHFCWVCGQEFLVGRGGHTSYFECDEKEVKLEKKKLLMKQGTVEYEDKFQRTLQERKRLRSEFKIRENSMEAQKERSKWAVKHEHAYLFLKREYIEKPKRLKNLRKKIKKATIKHLRVNVTPEFVLKLVRHAVQSHWMTSKFLRWGSFHCLWVNDPPSQHIQSLRSSLRRVDLLFLPGSKIYGFTNANWNINMVRSWLDRVVTSILKFAPNIKNKSFEQRFEQRRKEEKLQEYEEEKSREHADDIVWSSLTIDESQMGLSLADGICPFCNESFNGQEDLEIHILTSCDSSPLRRDNYHS